MALRTKERPIIMMGYERSGTTMLMFMLGMHPRIAVPEVTWYYPRFRPYLYTYGDLGQEANFRILAEEMIFGLMLPFLGRKVNPSKVVDEVLSFVQERSFGGLYAGIFDWFAQGEGKPRWGDKCPANVFHVADIKADLPDAQFVYVMRDGRDSGATYIQSTFGPANAYAAASLWKRWVNAAKRWRAQLDSSQWFDVRYEDLVRQPERTLRQLCDFLGEEYSPAMLEFYQGPLAQRRAKVKDHAPIGSPVTDKLVGVYKELLSLKEQRIFAGVAGKELVENGYEVDVEPLEVTEEEAAHFHEVDMRTRAAMHGLMPVFQRGHYWYNQWLVEQWEERRQRGVWSEADRPAEISEDERWFVQHNEDLRPYLDEFCVKRVYP